MIGILRGTGHSSPCMKLHASEKHASQRFPLRRRVSSSGVPSVSRNTYSPWSEGISAPQRVHPSLAACRSTPPSRLDMLIHRAAPVLNCTPGHANTRRDLSTHSCIVQTRQHDQPAARRCLYLGTDPRHSALGVPSVFTHPSSGGVSACSSRSALDAGESPASGLWSLSARVRAPTPVEISASSMLSSVS